MIAYFDWRDQWIEGINPSEFELLRWCSLGAKERRLAQLVSQAFGDHSFASDLYRSIARLASFRNALQESNPPIKKFHLKTICKQLDTWIRLLKPSRPFEAIGGCVCASTRCLV